MRTPILLVAALLAAGCSSAESLAVAPLPSAPAAPKPPAAPFLVKEAKLPAGFPPPGPVGEVVVKEYPAYRLARIVDGKGGVRGGPDGMFMPLLRHIERNEIPMTAPVEMGYPAGSGSPDKPAPEPASMAFLYGERDWGQAGGDPADARVVVEDVPAMLVVSIGVRGDYDDANFAAGLARLNAWLAGQAETYRPAGMPRYFGYNSPFVPAFLRYGEVQLPVARVEPTDEGDPQ